MDRLSWHTHSLSIGRALTLTVLLGCLVSAATASVLNIHAMSSSSVAAMKSSDHHQQTPAGDFTYLSTTLECSDNGDPVISVAEITRSLRTTPVVHVVPAGKPPSSSPRHVLSTVLRI